MPARVVRVIRVAVRCRRLVSGLDLESGVALDWLLHKQEESWVSGLAATQAGRGSGSGCYISRRRAGCLAAI